MILLYPLINKIDHLKYTTQILIYVSALFLLETMHYFAANYLPSTIVPIILSRCSLFISVTAGFLSARHKVFERICDITILKKSLLFITLIVIDIISRITLGELLSDIYGTLYTMPLVYIYCTTKHAHLEPILYDLGKASMGMWLISGIFFMPSGRLLKYAYFLRNPMLVLFWVLTFSYISSIMISAMKSTLSCYQKGI